MSASCALVTGWAAAAAGSADTSTASAARTPPAFIRTSLPRCHVGRGQPAVDCDRGPVDVRGLVACEEERRVDDLTWLRHPAHRQMHQSPLGRTRSLAPDP